MSQLTMQKMTEIEMEHFFSSPDNVLQALDANIAEGDEDGIRYILAECQKRGVDLAPAILREVKKHNLFASKEPMPVSGKPFRVPFHMNSKQPRCPKCQSTDPRYFGTPCIVDVPDTWHRTDQEQTSEGVEVGAQ